MLARLGPAHPVVICEERPLRRPAAGTLNPYSSCPETALGGNTARLWAEAGVDRIAPAWRLGYAAVNISEGPSPEEHQVAFAALAALHRRVERMQLHVRR